MKQFVLIDSLYPDNKLQWLWPLLIVRRILARMRLKQLCDSWLIETSRLLNDKRFDSRIKQPIKVNLAVSSTVN